MAVRTLASTQRWISADRRDAYRAAWNRLRESAEERGAHAWRFQSAEDPLLYIEFLEFKGSEDPRLDAAVARAVEQLDALFPGTRDEWVEPEEENHELTDS